MQGVLSFQNRPATGRHKIDVPAAADVAVVGAGVIGLSIAWRLTRRGLSVAVFERGTAGGGASLAATGMLAAAAEHEPGCHDLLALALESQRQWPEIRGQLEAQSGYDIDFRECGTLVVALNRDEVEGCDSVMICTSDAACQLSIWPDGRFVSSNLRSDPRLLPVSSAPKITRSTRGW